MCHITKNFNVFAGSVLREVKVALVSKVEGNKKILNFVEEDELWRLL